MSRSYGYTMCSGVNALLHMGQYDYIIHELPNGKLQLAKPLSITVNEIVCLLLTSEFSSYSYDKCKEYDETHPSSVKGTLNLNDDNTSRNWMSYHVISSVDNPEDVEKCWHRNVDLGSKVYTYATVEGKRTIVTSFIRKVTDDTILVADTLMDEKSQRFLDISDYRKSWFLDYITATDVMVFGTAIYEQVDEKVEEIGPILEEVLSEIDDIITNNVDAITEIISSNVYTNKRDLREAVCLALKALLRGLD